MSKRIIPTVKIKRTATGLGLVATTTIRKGRRIIQYVGQILNAKEADKKGGRYQYALSTRRSLDGSDRKNIARYINHACKPNAQAIIEGSEIWIYAIKTIAPGEEITVHYGKNYFETFISPKGCKCATCQLTA